MRVVFHHLPAEMASDGHECLLACLSFGEFCNTGVAQIVEAKTGGRAFDPVNVGFALLVFAGLSWILDLPTGGALN